MNTLNTYMYFECRIPTLCRCCLNDYLLSISSNVFECAKLSMWQCYNTDNVSVR